MNTRIIKGGFQKKVIACIYFMQKKKIKRGVTNFGFSHFKNEEFDSVVYLLGKLNRSQLFKNFNRMSPSFEDLYEGHYVIIKVLEN